MQKYIRAKNQLIKSQQSVILNSQDALSASSHFLYDFSLSQISKKLQQNLDETMKQWKIEKSVVVI